MIFLNLKTLFLLAESDDSSQYAAYVAVVVLLSFIVIFLSSYGRPILNSIISVWEKAFYLLTNRSFSFYPGFKKHQLPFEQREYLFKHVYYYKFLSSTQRGAFDHRLSRFLNSRDFVGKQGVEITKEMQLLISASAIQITFGFRSFMIKEFSQIFVYPKAYYNKISKRYHKGEVNANGLVLLSWEDFVEGIAIPDDNLNLGIHEFAHTLALQRLKNRIFTDAFFVRSFDKLMANISNPVFRKRIQERAGLRSYAMSNQMEFFAVATEAFFENPFLLYQNHKTIYRLFVSMYNQDLITLYNRPINPLTKP